MQLLPKTTISQARNWTRLSFAGITGLKCGSGRRSTWMRDHKKVEESKSLMNHDVPLTLKNPTGHVCSWRRAAMYSSLKTRMVSGGCAITGLRRGRRYYPHTPDESAKTRAWGTEFWLRWSLAENHTGQDSRNCLSKYPIIMSSGLHQRNESKKNFDHRTIILPVISEVIVEWYG